MTEHSPPDRLRVLYLRGKRAKWWPLLADSGAIDAEAVSWVAPRRPPPILRFASTVRRFRPHVVLAEYSGLRHLPLRPLCRLFRLPLAVAVKGDPWREAADPPPPGRRIERAFRAANLRASVVVLRSADLLLPLTAALDRAVRARLGPGPPSRVVPIPFTEPPHGPPAERPPFALTVTSFRFRSKVAPLVGAASVLAPVLSDLDLDWRILGDGPFLKSVRERLAAYPRIRCPGYRDPHPDVRAARLFLYFSDLDGLPNALMEAALHRLPIVVHAGSPAAELIRDGDTGRVVDLADPAQTADAVRELASDPELGKRLGHAAESWVRESFAPGRVAARLEAALRAVARKG